MKIIAFVGETFSEYKGNHYTKPTSIAFLQDTFGKDNVYAASPAVSAERMPQGSSTEIESSKFFTFPGYTSTKQFFINCLTKKGFYKEYVSKADEVIEKNKGSLFWIRTPSIGSIVFGLRVLKADQKVLHHMCADPSNTWKDAKYTGFNKAMAFVISRFIRQLLKKICSHPNTTNFCTGDVLESFSKKHSANTHQFVDVMIKSVDVSAFEPYKKTPDKLNLLFVGRMVSDKGIFDLINVIKQLKGKVNLTFVGDGPDLEKAKKQSQQEGLSEIITFTGQLPHSELSALFHSSDLITVPSNNNYEGFPRVIMEAWSFTKPVIVSNVGGINAFVKHGDNGLIIKPGDQGDLKKNLEKCLDEELYQSIKSGAHKMVDKSLQKYWSETIRLIVGGV